MKEDKNPAINRMSWKEFFKPSTGKVISTVILALLSFFYIFYVLSTIFDFDPSSYWDQALSNPIAILFLAPSVASYFLLTKYQNYFIPIAGIILQIIYSYFLICTLFFLLKRNKKDQVKFIKPTKKRLLIIFIILVLVYFSNYLANIEGAHYNKIVESTILTLVFPGMLIGSLVIFPFLANSSTSLSFDLTLISIVTITISTLFWYFIYHLVAAVYSKIKNKT